MARTGSDPSELSLDRTVNYSDAVIAIALTLLALDLPVPPGQDESEVWASFVAQFSWLLIPVIAAVLPKLRSRGLANRG